MKVVLFCGGLGTRLMEHSQRTPKPIVSICTRPILWHLMKYYAHYGHDDFIICLGYGGGAIKDFFLNSAMQFHQYMRVHRKYLLQEIVSHHHSDTCPTARASCS